MSGSGGGGGGGGGGSSSGVSCSALTIRTALNSPKASVISKLSVGDRLTVEFVPPKGPLVAKTKGGEIAGSITAAEMQLLIRCMADDWKYVAEIVSIKGGHCEVLIKAKE